MKSDKILILGSCGQIGVELTLALRTQYGNDAVIATDIKEEHGLLKGTGPFYQVDVMDINAVFVRFPPGKTLHFTIGLSL